MSTLQHEIPNSFHGFRLRPTRTAGVVDDLIAVGSRRQPIPVGDAMTVVCMRPHGLAEHWLHEPLPLGELAERDPAHWTR